MADFVWACKLGAVLTLSLKFALKSCKKHFRYFYKWNERKEIE